MRHFFGAMYRNRKFAVDEILRIRNEDGNVRLRKNPDIVLTAEKPILLIRRRRM